MFVLLVFALAALTALLSSSPPPAAARTPVFETPAPSFAAPTPRAVYYVSPAGGGNGAQPDRPLDLTRALAQAQPGDWYWLTEGVYRGLFELRRPGTAEAPIVLRAQPGARAVIEGGLIVNAPHIWVWGLEITDPNDVAGVNPGLSIGRKTQPGPIDTTGVHVINNYIHGIYNNHGLTMWNFGGGQMAYGNIIIDGVRDRETNRAPHGIYTQNDFDAYGYKYFIDNILIGAGETCNRCFNFHGFSRGGHVSGLVLDGNIIVNGSVEIGASSEHPAAHNILQRNLLDNAYTRLGYNRVFQAQITDNVFWNSRLDMRRWWGDDYSETVGKPAPNVVTGNVFAHVSDSPIRLATTRADGTQGQARLPADDLFDYNRYYLYTGQLGSFLAAAGLGNVKAAGLAEWQTLSAEAGNSFDRHATTAPLPTAPAWRLTANRFEPERLHLAVINWPGQSAATLTPAGPLHPLRRYAVLRADALREPPVATAVFGRPLTLPLEPGINAFVLIPIGSATAWTPREAR